MFGNRHPLLGTMTVAISVGAALLGLSACGTSANPVAPKFVNATSTDFTVGSSADFKIATTDPGAALSRSGTLPAGVSFRSTANGSATLSGVPADGSGGRYTLLLSAHGAGGNASQHLTLTVNQPPNFAKADGGTLYAVAFKHDNTPITTSGYPSPTITESGALPSGMSFKAFANGTALISGTPQLLGSPGDFVITLTASNSSGTATKTITVLTGDAVTVCAVLCPFADL